jgi:hypothetical protein
VQGAPSGDDATTVLDHIQADVATGFGDVVSVSRQGDTLVVQAVGDKPHAHAWAVANYLVARARVLDVGRVLVGTRVWDRDTGTWASTTGQSRGTVTVSPA